MSFLLISHNILSNLAKNSWKICHC